MGWVRAESEPWERMRAAEEFFLVYLEWSGLCRGLRGVLLQYNPQHISTAEIVRALQLYALWNLVRENQQP